MIAALLLQIVIEEAGHGFRARGEVPNLTLRPGTWRDRVFVGRMDAWLPFRVAIHNRGAAVEGVLTVREAVEGRVVYRKDVNLPQGSRKRISFPVLHESFAGMEIRIEDRSGNRLLTAPLDLPHSIPLTSPLILVATESRGSFVHFLDRQGTRLLANRYVVPVAGEDLPAHAIEYQAVDVLVLDDIAIDALSPDQQDAIVQFAARGGVLVVCLHRQAARVAGTRIESVLPGLPGALRNVESLGPAACLAGVPCRLDAPVALTTFDPREQAVVWDVAGLHRRFEQGTVILLGFAISSPAIETWAGAPRLMESLTAAWRAPAIPMHGSVHGQNIRQSMAVALKSSMIRTLPPFGIVLGLLIGYGALLIFVPYAGFKLKGRLEYAWGAIVVLALAGSGGVYGVGQRYLRRDVVAHRIGVVEGGAEDGPRVRHNFWAVFSADGSSVDLAFEEPSSIPHPLGRELESLNGEADPARMTIGLDGTHLPEFAMHAQDSRLFETTDVQVLPGRIRCSLSRGIVRLTHDASFPFGRGWLVWEDAVCPVSGAETRFEGRAIGPEGDPLFDHALEAILKRMKHESRGRRQPILVYTYDGAPALKTKTLPERGIDFGILAMDPPPNGRQRVVWSPCTAGATDVDLIYKLQEVPTRARVATLQVRASREIDLYDWGQGEWTRVVDGAVDPERFVHRTPLGMAYARARVPVKGGRVRTEDIGFESVLEERP